MSLRDQLLAKGLVSKKQARRADQEARHERKQGEGAKKRKRELDAQAAAQAEAERQARAHERQQRRAEYEGQRAITERALQVRNTILGNRIRATGGAIPFHFVALDGRTLRRLQVGAGLVQQLRRGDAAIVAQEGRETEYVVVTRQAAIKLEEIAPRLVVSWARDPVGLSAPDQQPLVRDWEPSLIPRRATEEDLRRMWVPSVPPGLR